MICVTLGWVSIFVLIAFVIGLVFGIKLGISWIKKSFPPKDI